VLTCRKSIIIFSTWTLFHEFSLKPVSNTEFRKRYADVSLWRTNTAWQFFILLNTQCYWLVMIKSVKYRLITEGFKHRTLYHNCNFQTPDHSYYCTFILEEEKFTLTKLFIERTNVRADSYDQLSWQGSRVIMRRRFKGLYSKPSSNAGDTFLVRWIRVGRT
jgi:hypothetical protein